MVFTHRVAKDKVKDYLAWRRKAIDAQTHYLGYIATEFFQPHGSVQNEWVDIVRYDNLDHLNDWMESKELQGLDCMVESVHAHDFTGLERWFALNRGPGATVSVPPSWKQALAVLFALYPTVMVLTFLNPLTHNLSLA